MKCEYVNSQETLVYKDSAYGKKTKKTKLTLVHCHPYLRFSPLKGKAVKNCCHMNHLS